MLTMHVNCEQQIYVCVYYVYDLTFFMEFRMLKLYSLHTAYQYVILLISICEVDL